jgi:hypothetical protein
MDDPALVVETVPGLGNTFVAARDIKAGELLLRERPLLIATSPSELTPAMRERYDAGSDERVDVDDLLLVHAFARADEAVRSLALTNCGAEACCSVDHDIIQSARAAAEWSRANDAASAQLSSADLERICCIFALNAFGLLADTDGKTSVRHSPNG